MQKLAGFIRPTVATAAHQLYPKIDLSACVCCAGAGKRVVNGIEWWCFSCGGSGTKVQHGGLAA